MRIPGILWAWQNMVRAVKTPGVPTVSDVQKLRGMPVGEEHNSAETEEFSGRKRGEAQTYSLYGQDGKTKDEDDPPGGPKLDEHA